MDNFNCDEFQALISTYIDNELDDASKTKLEEHMLSCEKCKIEHDNINLIVTSLKELEWIELPQGFHEELMRKIKADNKSSYKLPNRRRIINFPAFRRYAALAASFLFVYFMISGLVRLIIPEKNLSPEIDMRISKKAAAPEAAANMFSADIAQGTTDEYDDAIYNTNGAMGNYKAVSPSQPMARQSLESPMADMSAAEAANGNIIDENIKTKEEDVLASSEIAASPSIELAEVQAFSGEAEETAVMDDAELSENILITQDSLADDVNVKLYNISISTEDYDNAINVINSMSPYIVSNNTYDDGYIKYASVNFKPPVYEYENTINIIKTTGEVTNESESEYSVSFDMMNVNSGLTAKEQEYNNLLELLSQTEAVGDMLKLENRLQQVISEMERLKLNLRNWKDESANPLIFVNISEETPNETIMPDEEPLGERLKDGIVSSVNSTARVFEKTTLWAVSAVIPLAVLAVVSIAAYYVYKLLRRRWRDENRN